MSRRRTAGSRRAPSRAMAGRGVVRAVISSSEWVLAAPPPDSPLTPAGLRRLALGLLAAARDISQAPGGFELRPVPRSLIDPRLGLALLHYRDGRSVTYCPASQVTIRAAEALSALASRAAGASSPATPGCDVTDIEIARVGHAQLPPRVHPAAAFRRGTRLTIAICSDLITPDLAAALGSLGSAQCSLLAGYGQDSRRNGPAGRKPGPDQDGFRLIPPPAAGLPAAVACRGRWPGQGQWRRAVARPAAPAPSLAFF
jgi:hypothetical protein